MKTKLFLILLLGVLLIGNVYALDNLEDAGTQGRNFTLIQTCSDATYITLSTIQYPAKTVSVINANMTSLGSGSGAFGYNFTDTTELGRYDVTGISDGCENTFATYFEISYSGEELNISKAILNLGFLVLVIILFISVVVLTGHLPNGNDEDGFGKLMSINNLKYLNYCLYLVAYGLLLGVFFLASNISKAYLTNAMFGSILFAIFKILMVLAYPLVLFMLIFIFVSIFKDREMKQMMDRGVTDGY